MISVPTSLNRKLCTFSLSSIKTLLQNAVVKTSYELKEKETGYQIIHFIFVFL